MRQAGQAEKKSLSLFLWEWVSGKWTQISFCRASGSLARSLIHLESLHYSEAKNESTIRIRSLHKENRNKEGIQPFSCVPIFLIPFLELSKFPEPAKRASHL
jgi:hypothetical protein